MLLLFFTNNQLTRLDVCASRYVMDELGSALRHSDEPNFRVSPFLYMPDGKLASAIRFSFLAAVLLIISSSFLTR